MGYGWTFRDGDWKRLRQIIQKIASIKLGPESTPMFASLTLTELAGTYSQMVYADTDGTLQAESDLTNWIAGTANQITVTDDTDGTLTLSVPDVFQVGTSGQFGTLTVSSGSITDSSGAISFGNENLTTTGATTTSTLKVTAPSSQDYVIGAGTHPLALAIIAQNTGASRVDLFAKDGDGTDNVFYRLFSEGTSTDETNASYLDFRYQSTVNEYWINSGVNGTGTIFPFVIFVASNTNQLRLNTNGSIDMSAGNLNVTTGDVIVTGAGVSTTYNSNDLTTTSSTFQFTSSTGGFVFAGSGGEDVTIVFSAITNTGQFAWMEDEDYFRFSDDIVFLGGGFPYGHMTNDTGNTITIGVAGTWVEASDTYTTWTTGLVNLVTFGGSHYLAVTVAGIYEVIVSASLEGTTAGDKIGVAAAVNGTAQTAGHAHSTIGNTNDQVGMSTSYILSLSANDQVSVAVTNHTAARDVDIIHSSLTLKMVGG